MASRQHIERVAKTSGLTGSIADLVESALRFAQRRDLILGASFANPAWDIMLRLYLAGLEARDLPLQSLIEETGRSNVTERWLDALIQEGLVTATRSKGSGVVRLTAHGKASMDALFASAQAGTPIS